VVTGKVRGAACADSPVIKGNQPFEDIGHLYQ